MAEQQERGFTPPGEVALEETTNPGAASTEVPEQLPEGVPQPERAPAAVSVATAEVGGPENPPAAGTVETPSRHAQAGRKGARRVHQLIQEGRLYEQVHGLK